jgi:hypothetical protein
VWRQTLGVEALRSVVSRIPGGTAEAGVGAFSLVCDTPLWVGAVGHSPCCSGEEEGPVGTAGAQGSSFSGLQKALAGLAGLVGPHPLSSLGQRGMPHTRPAPRGVAMHGLSSNALLILRHVGPSLLEILRGPQMLHASTGMLHTLLGLLYALATAELVWGSGAAGTVVAGVGEGEPGSGVPEPVSLPRILKSVSEFFLLLDWQQRSALVRRGCDDPVASVVGSREEGDRVLLLPAEVAQGWRRAFSVLERGALEPRT